MESVIGSSEDWLTTSHPHSMPYGFIELAENEVFINGCIIPSEQQNDLIIPNVIDDKMVVGIDGGTFCQSGLINEFAIHNENRTLHKIIISEGIKYIGDSTFQQCINLEEVSLPSTLEYLGTSCFQQCKKLKKIKIPDKITVIRFNTFCDCESLEMVLFPSRLEKIEICAFAGSGLKTVVLSEGIEEIQYSAFACCDNLKTVMLPRSLNIIGDEVFKKLVYNYNTKRVESVHNDDIIVYCYPGSYALLYARENNYHVRNADI